MVTTVDLSANSTMSGAAGVGAGADGAAAPHHAAQRARRVHPRRRPQGGDGAPRTAPRRRCRRRRRRPQRPQHAYCRKQSKRASTLQMFHYDTSYGMEGIFLQDLISNSYQKTSRLRGTIITIILVPYFCKVEVLLCCLLQYSSSITASRQFARSYDVIIRQAGTAAGEPDRYVCAGRCS